MNKPVKSSESATPQATALRKRAEETVREKTVQSPENLKALSPDEVRQMLHELEVHQVELEMQNEELRREHEKLDAALARYFDLYDLAPMGYVTLSEQGLILEANLAASTLMGVTRGDLTRQPFSRFILKEDCDIYYLHRKQLLEAHSPSSGQAGAPQPLELRMVKQDGTTLWVHMDVTAAQDADGTPECRIVMKDISARKEAEEELRKSQEQLRDAHRLAHIGIWNWIAETDTVTWTEELYHITGRDPMIPAPTFAEHSNIYAPESWDHLKESVDRAMKTNEAYQLELKLIRPDGTTRWVIAFGGTTCDNQGRIKGLHGTVQDITERWQAEEHLKETLEKLRKSLIGTIQALSSTVETRDPYTAGHQRKVSNLARAIAQEMGLPYDTVDTIRMAGIIHDIGKISVPAEILSKPGILSSIEISLIRVHSQSGYDILKDVGLPYPIAEIALQHHERLDGSGYPQGLKNGQILLEARIISIADVVEAIASYRPYRPALGIDVALEEIEKNAEILYDGEAVEACLRLFREKGFEFESRES